MPTSPSPNFSFLAYHDARLVALGTQAEEHFRFASTSRAAARLGILPPPNETQQALVDRLFDKGAIGATQRSLFHDLRRAGNAAVHEDRGDANEALHQLRMARELAVWFQRSFGNNRKFDPGPFVPPAASKKVEAASPALHEELTRAKAFRGELVPQDVNDEPVMLTNRPSDVDADDPPAVSTTKRRGAKRRAS